MEKLPRRKFLVGAGLAGSAVACVPVADLPPTTLQLAWRWGSREPATAAFVHTTRMTMDIQRTAG